MVAGIFPRSSWFCLANQEQWFQVYFGTRQSVQETGNEGAGRASSTERALAVVQGGELAKLVLNERVEPWYLTKESLKYTVFRFRACAVSSFPGGLRRELYSFCKRLTVFW
jgi:hypothetical protein